MDTSQEMPLQGEGSPISEAELAAERAVVEEVKSKRSIWEEETGAVNINKLINVAKEATNRHPEIRNRREFIRSLVSAVVEVVAIPQS